MNLMNPRIPLLICLACLVGLICLNPAGVLADDMRQSFAVQAEKRAQMEEKAREELARARAEAQARTRQIKQDKDALTAAIQDLKSRNKTLETDNQALAQLIRERQAAKEALNEELAQSRAENRELSGFIRSAAKDLEGLLLQSPQSALSDNRHGFLNPVLQAERFPSMTDIRAMADAWFHEISVSGTGPDCKRPHCRPPGPGPGGPDPDAGKFYRNLCAGTG
ncbi:MAG: hypothetical protein U5K27_12925 [Desulfotignum sp.]|nr:hypothetical protein [Desulfotignum sp.]